MDKASADLVDISNKLKGKAYEHLHTALKYFATAAEYALLADKAQDSDKPLLKQAALDNFPEIFPS